MSTSIKVDPPAAIPGGEVRIEHAAVLDRSPANLSISFAGRAAHQVAGGAQRSLVIVPQSLSTGEIEVAVRDESGVVTQEAGQCLVGKKIAGEVHPVANPAFDPRDGSLYVTRSGSRGEHVPVSIYRIDSDGGVDEFSPDIMNPTGIAFDRTGRMFVTSRFDGSVNRITPDREVIMFAADLGIATGIAFNRDGEMFVGDRSGTIYRVNEIGEAKPWALHEPSVSAYHLAFGPDDALYVTGPTISSFESVTRFDEDGHATPFHNGLGRPQGLAFDRSGNLYVAASIRGRRGIVRISPDGVDAELVVAGMNVVGLAFGPAGEMAVATNDAVYSLPLGINGTLLNRFA
jgi:sugar lactone lactonase YvrE